MHYYELNPQQPIGPLKASRYFPYGSCMYRGYRLILNSQGRWWIDSMAWMDAKFDSEWLAAEFVDTLIELKDGESRIGPKLELAAPYRRRQR